MRSKVRPLLAVTLLALAVRLAALPVVGRAPLGEGALLLHVAGNLAQGKGLTFSAEVLDDPPQAGPILRHTLAHWRSLNAVWGVVTPGTPTAFLPPLYPVLLSLTAPQGEPTLWPRLMGIAFGTLSVALVFLLARSLVPIPLVAGVLAALDPLAVFQASEISTHQTAACLSLAPFFLLLALPPGRGAPLAGLVAGIAFLCRPTAWLLVVLGGWYLWARGRRHVVAFLLGWAVVVSPWVVRNAHHVGRALLFPTNGGRNLWEFNNQKMAPEYEWAEPSVSRRLYDPIRRAHLAGLKRPDLAPFPRFTHEPEWERDRILTQRFLGFVRANPLVYLRLVGVRVTQMLSPWPLHGGRLVRTAMALYWVPVLYGAAVGVWSAMRTNGVMRMVGLFSAAFVAIHVLTAAGFVYRGMISPHLALLSAYGWGSLLPQRLKGRSA